MINKLFETQNVSDADLSRLIDLEDGARLFERAMERRREFYGNTVYFRGLLEITNYCRNNCFYCGLRAANHEVTRYRLTPEDIITTCDEGYRLGFRTFVLQGGEDRAFSDEIVADIVREIMSHHPDCAVTLSLGEKSPETYELWYRAGARRYLLRHEAACKRLYQQLHPETMSHENRVICLKTLKAIGYQTGAGFMVGAPHQTINDIIADIRFLQELKPDMIGIGPFIPCSGTPMSSFEAGSLKRTLNLLAILRLMFPRVLLPSTTALGTLVPGGRLLGLQAGANVVMPNLTPASVRKFYAIYDNKLATGAESAQSLDLLRKEMASVGFELVSHRGDRADFGLQNT